ncbi:hypothetical protein [Streptomyces sp. NPDC002346]
MAQGAALITRHRWPLTVLGCLAAARVRRATAVATVVDIAFEYRHDRDGLVRHRLNACAQDEVLSPFYRSVDFFRPMS